MKKLLRLAIFLPLTTASLAQELQGVAAILQQIAEKSGQPAQKAADPLDDLHTQVQQFKKDAATLPPAEAARRWMALLESSLSLPQEQLFSSRSEGKQVRLAHLVAALPPPASWDEISRLIAGRKTDDPLQNDSLLLLTAVLRGDTAAAEKTLESMRAALKAKKGMESYQRSTYQRYLTQVTTLIADLSGSGVGKVTAFEEELEKMEKGGAQTGRSIRVPDLVRFADEKTATTLLTRAIKSGLALYIDGEATRLKAADLALKNIGSLTQPMWYLVTSLDHAPLYEAMAAKFPDAGNRDRSQAVAIYLLALVANDRTQDAVKLVLESDVAEEASMSINVKVLDHMNRQGLGKQVLAFLQQLLARDATLPYWPTFIELSARQGASAEALKLLQESLAKPSLPAEAKTTMQSLYYEALLAADQRDEGIRVLRKLVQAGPPKLKKSRQGMGDDGGTAYASLCVKLTKLGSLLKKPELIEEGINAATSMLGSFPNDDPYKDMVLAEVVELLLDNDHAAKAEQLLAATLGELATPGEKKEALENERFDQPLNMLACLYDKAGRHKDVVALLEQMPYWNASDLASLEKNETRDSPFLVMAARALAETGRQDDARRIIRRAMQNSPENDAAYAMLLRLESGQPLLDLLDELAKRDRFEERPLIWKARVLLDSGKVDEAEKTIKAAIAIDPSDGEQGKGDRMRAYAILAEVLEQKGDADTAKVMRGAVTAIRKSEDADDWWTAGLLSEAVRRYEAALLDFADAYCIQSRLALRYSEMGEFDKAERHYLRAFELMPDSFGRVESHCFGCEGAFKGLRAQTTAEKVFTRLASLPPVKAQVHYLLGYLREAQGRPADAAAAYRQAVKTDPDYLNAWSKLAGLAESAPLTREESENAALQIFRLDPAGHHGHPPTSHIRDLRRLWTAILAAEASQPAKEKGPLLTLTAAKKRIESENTDDSDRRIFHSDDDDDNSPRQQLLQNELVRTLVELVDTLRSI